MLLPAAHDDPAFLEHIEPIILGAAAGVDELYLLHLDNWFDHKWCGYWSRRDEDELRLPPFNPNRILSQRRLTRSGPTWTDAAPGNPLHIKQPGRPWLTPPLSRIVTSALFAWYSGNTLPNKTGSLMIYQTGGQETAWYASFQRRGQWTLHKTYKTTHELVEQLRSTLNKAN
jgi:hypothetical protein